MAKSSHKRRGYYDIIEANVIYRVFHVSHNILFPFKGIKDNA
jgi:hypothetical protein